MLPPAPAKRYTTKNRHPLLLGCDEGTVIVRGKPDDHTRLLGGLGVETDWKQKPGGRRIVRKMRGKVETTVA